MAGGFRRDANGNATVMRIPFKITILSLFLVLSLGLAGTVITYNFNEGSETAATTGDRLLTLVSERIAERTRLLFDPMFRLAETAARLPAIDSPPTLAPHPAAPFLLATVDGHAAVSSAYMGYADGTFYQVVSLGGDGSMAKALDAPDGARYALRSLFAEPDGTRIEAWRFLDADRRTLGSRVIRAPDYDPTARGWYALASRDGAPVITEPYRFASSGMNGITVARPFDGARPGVFGVDLTFETIDSLFDEQRQVAFGGDERAVLALFNRAGRLIAEARDTAETQASVISTDLPTLSATQDTVEGQLYAAALAMEDGETASTRFKVGGDTYLAQIAYMPERYGDGLYVGVAAPEAVLLGPLASAHWHALAISIAVVLFFIPFVYFGSDMVTRPLHAVIRQVDAIRRFDLERRADFRSAIAEIDDLGTAVERMRTAFQVFGKYVPTALVQQTISSGTLPRLGGERRHITVLFTDAQDFTPLSQRLAPEDLMHAMSDYFTGMIGCIHARNGVVDKFVGDAIMAYWNAPHDDPDHVANACLAALECRALTNHQHAMADGEGGTGLYTRFGLHTGPAVVGNVGSEDRMDYTVMGGPINLGERLESLNKAYGTQILTSEHVTREAGPGFVYRSMDWALPKGALEPIRIFELVGVMPDHPEATERIAATPAQIERCAAWEEVLAFYEERRWPELLEAAREFEDRFEGDQVAAVYRKRAEKFIAEPPPDDWNGVTIYLTKR